MSKIQYLRRILSAYIFSRNSQLNFWHEDPAENLEASGNELGQYYMTFEQKARYQGPFDENGIPLLDYLATVGRQFNPIAIAQYALANFNFFKRTGIALYSDKFLSNADWLLDNLQETSHGTYLWPHHFDFEYFRPLVAPWYSGLAQGQGLSVLVRAFAETSDGKYESAMASVFQSLCLTINKGGVLYIDGQDYVWIEEYLVDPPTHILNGFLWALWGVYDYFLLTRSRGAKELLDTCTRTVLTHLPNYDAGFWSYYELTPQRIKSLASPFYHRLHIVQLHIMHRLTGYPEFLQYAGRWEEYARNSLYRTMALIYKAGFKLAYY